MCRGTEKCPQGGLLAWRPWAAAGWGVSPGTGSFRETSWRRRHPKRPCKCILRDLGGLITDTEPGWGARETDLLFTHGIFFFLIKSVYLAIVGSLQTQALTDVTITDLLLASYVAAACTSPSMEEETGRARHGASPGVTELGGAGAGTRPQKADHPAPCSTHDSCNPTADTGDAPGCSHLAGGASAGWGVRPAQGRRAVRHRAGP